MTLSKQHFEMIARILRETDAGDYPAHIPLCAAFKQDERHRVEAHTARSDRKRLAETFADEFASTNERFDRERFLTASGVEL